MTLDEETEIQLGWYHDASGPTVKVSLLRTTARRILPRSPEILEEAVQEAAHRLFAGPAQVTNPEGYASAVARNVARDMRRKERRQGAIETKRRGNRQKVFRHDLEVYAIFLEYLEEIRDKLGERQRAVALRVFQGYKKSEIAADLGVSVRVVFKDLKSIKALISSLDPRDPNSPGGGGVGRGRPPPRGDPMTWRQKEGARRVAVLRNGRTPRPKEVSDELQWTGRDALHPGLRRRGVGMSALRSRSELGPGTDEKAAIRIRQRLQYLLLQLPAFRDAGLSPDHSRDAAEPENLGEVLRQLVRDGGA